MVEWLAHTDATVEDLGSNSHLDLDAHLLFFLFLSKDFIISSETRPQSFIDRILYFSIRKMETCSIGNCLSMHSCQQPSDKPQLVKCCEPLTFDSLEQLTLMVETTVLLCVIIRNAKRLLSVLWGPHSRINFKQ